MVSQLAGYFLSKIAAKRIHRGTCCFSARIIPYRGSWLDFEFDPKDCLYFRIDRRRKMPVTTLLKAIGCTVEQILEEFFIFDCFYLSDKGIQFELVPERLRGEVASFDIVAKNKNVIVEKNKRITAKHIREMQEMGIKQLDVPEDFLLGRALAQHIVDKETGEIVASANDEITEELLAKLRKANIKKINTLYINDLNHGAYISQTLRIDETADEMAAQVAIYRMMRPGEPPTEEAVKSLFYGLFYSAERYDLSVVGRMKFNRRVGRTELEGSSTLSNEDIIAVIKILVELRNGRGEIDDIDHLGNRRVRSVGELAENQLESGLVRVSTTRSKRTPQSSRIG